MAADVRTLQYLISIKADGASQVVDTMKKLGIEVKKVGDSATKTAKSFTILGADVGKLASRAAVTIPIWLAMREAFMFLIKTFQDGLKYIEELDKALTRISLVTTGVADIKSFLVSVQAEMERLARTTGKSVTEIGEAFYKFGTAGIEGARALEGMTQAVKTAANLQGESGETAILLADAYKLLGDTLPKTIREEEKLAYIGSTLTLLEKENTFTVHEMSDAFHKFAPVAANMNLTLDEMLGLLASLHTLGIRGSEAGTSLARAFLFLEKEGERVAEVLGRAVDIKMEDKFQLYMELVSKLNEEFARTGDVSEELRDIFGMKAITGTASLVKAIEVINKNMKDLQEASFNARKELENTRYSAVINEIESLSKANKELLNQITGKFWENALGGIDNYKAALSDLSIILQHVTPLLKGFGDILSRTINWMLTPIRTTGTVLGALTGAIQSSRGNKDAALKAGIEQALPGLTKGATFGFVDTTQTTSKTSTATSQVTNNVNKNVQTTTENLDKQLRSASKIKEEFSKKLDILAKENKAILEGVKYTEDWQIAQAELKADISSIVSKYTDMAVAANKLSQYSNSQFKTLSEQEVLTSLLVGDYNKIYDLVRSKAISEEQFLKLVDSAQKTNKKIIDDKKKELEYTREIAQLEIEYATIWGVSAVQIEKMKLDYLKEQGATKEELRDQTKELMKAEMSAIQEYANAIKGVFSSAFKNALTGAESPKEALDSLMTGISDTFATALTERITSALASTGLFESSGGLLAGLAGSFGGIGSQISTSMTMAGTNVSQMWSNSIISAGSTVAGMFSSAISGSAPGGTQSSASAAKTKSPGALDYGVAGLMGGLSGYAAASRGGNKGLGYAGAAIGGIGAMLSMNPATAPIGIAMSFVPFLMGLFGKKKTETTVETRESTQQVATRIDVTNKQLQLVNRNLIALRSTMETYIMPESAYFSTKRNLEDQFSLSARRGGG